MAFDISCRRYCCSVHVRGDIRRRIPDVIQKTPSLHVHQTGWVRQPLVHSVTWPGLRFGVRQSSNCRVSKGVRLPYRLHQQLLEFSGTTGYYVILVLVSSVCLLLGSE